MNKISYTMGAMLLPLALTGCSGMNDSSAVIERPNVQVIDGQMTPEILEAFGRVSEPVVSPDGKTVIYTVAFSSVEENKSNAEIYSMNIDGTNVKRLTKSAASEANLRWTPDGRRILFIRNDADTEKQQIFGMDADGCNVRRLTKMENGVECFELSPDATKIIMGCPIKPYNKNQEVFQGLDKTSGRLVDDLMYKHWDEWVTMIPHPFLADYTGVSVENAKDIMEGEPFECPMRPFGAADAFAWAPDSKSLVYVSRKLTGLEYSFSTDSNLYLYNLADGSSTLLTEGMEGYDTDPKFSPDGKTLAWLSMQTPKFESDKKRLMLMDMATREMRDLTADWDYWPEGINWDKNGKSIVFNGYYQGTEPIFRIDTATAKIDTIATGVWDYSSVQPMADGRVIAIRNNMATPKELCLVDNGDVKPITHINDELLAQLNPISVEKKLVPTTDGGMMTVWVVLPPNFDPNKKYPALLYCQGGPQQAVSQFWSNRWNFRMMASQGYVVIAPNRHGVPGFGEAWNRQISGDYGGQNMRDYLTAVDYMKQEPYIDGAHIGAIGASYGGFSVYWLAGHHEGRFAALIAHAGIFNLEAQYLETEEMWFADFDMGGAPWDKTNAIAQATFATSPHHFTDNWTAPILVTVGELDYRILASQGMMAFNAAKMHGLEAEMLVFPDENHWVIKPQNAILWQRVFFRFLDKYLKNGNGSTPAATTATDEETASEEA